jgi:hypothetical protein
MKLREEQAKLDEKRRKKKEAYDNMIRRQEEKVRLAEKHRREQDEMQSRQVEALDQEKEEKRIEDLLREEDRKLAKERSRRREEHRRKKIEAERARKNERADQIARERERLKRERINARLQGMKKRSEVTGMFEKLQVMGGGDIEKLETTMAKKFGMKPIDKTKLFNKKQSSSLTGINSRQRPSSARPSRSKKVRPMVSSSIGKDNDGKVETISILSSSSQSSSGRQSRRQRPSSAAPSRRSTKSIQGRPASSRRKRKKGKVHASDKPDMTIEGIRTRHNEQLLRVLEQEQEKEERRERILRGIKVRTF